VHDVKLGDPAEDANPASSANNRQSQPPVPSASIARNTMSRPDPADLRAMSSMFGSRGAMSFAAAAMAGLASVSGRGIRGSSRDRRGLGLGGSSSEHHNRLTFTVGGRQLSKNLTIYQAIQRQLVHDEEDEERFGGSDLPNDGSRFWSDIFTITYQKADGSAAQGGPGSASSSAKSKTGSSRAGSDGRVQVSLFDSLLQGELPCDMERSNPTYNIVALLRMLEGLNQLAPRLRIQAVSDDFAEGRIDTFDELYRTGGKVPREDFVNNKLTPKLSRQIQDVLALCSGSLPSWCYQLTKSCPFLFPFETRRQYFYSTAFGLSRALYRLQQQQGADNTNSSSEREVRVGRLQRQKVRVSRNRILDSAAKVMEMFSSQKAVLEVEYFGEVGTGLGPTLEFYTLLSHDLQKAGLGLWRSSSGVDDSSVMETDIGSDGKKPGVDLTGKRDDLVHAPLGLFPRPWPVIADMSEGSQFYKVVEHFRLIGQVMAKALQDGRLLDLPMSTAFYKLVLGQVSVVLLLGLLLFAKYSKKKG
jgi:E3 ubiquitin-protein ligase TRIP12